MDAAGHYRYLITLGRDEFLSHAAPAALVRYRTEEERGGEGLRTMTVDQDEPLDETLEHGQFQIAQMEMEVFPLVKKAGASFPDRITIGRTTNNDIVIANHSISRLHAYVKVQGYGWVVADAGSKNGSWLRGDTLEARRERNITSRTVLRLGDVDLTFYIATDLYMILGGMP